MTFGAHLPKGCQQRMIPLRTKPLILRKPPKRSLVKGFSVRFVSVSVVFFRWKIYGWQLGVVTSSQATLCWRFLPTVNFCILLWLLNMGGCLVAFILLSLTEGSQKLWAQFRWGVSILLEAKKRGVPLWQFCVLKMMICMFDISEPCYINFQVRHSNCTLCKAMGRISL